MFAFFHSNSNFFLSIFNSVSETESDSSKIQQTQVSKEDFINSCGQYNYKEIARNPDRYKGVHAYFAGKVLQVQESGSYAYLRADVTRDGYGLWDNTIFIEYRNYNKGEGRILEDDIIKIYGTLNGIKKYEALFGNEVSIPYMIAEYLEYILSMGFFTTEKKIKKSGLELAFEDIEKGRVHRLITPKNRES